MGKNLNGRSGQAFRSPLVPISICLIAIVFLVLISGHFSSAPQSPSLFASERAEGEIQVSSRAALLDKFVQADRFLEQQGFHTAAQPPSAPGMKSGVITPDMITLYYQGSYRGSRPFGFRVDLDLSGNNLLPYVEAYASTKLDYDSQEEASHAFLDLFCCEDEQRTLSRKRFERPVSSSRSQLCPHQSAAVSGYTILRED